MTLNSSERGCQGYSLITPLDHQISIGRRTHSGVPLTHWVTEGRRKSAAPYASGRSARSCVVGPLGTTNGPTTSGSPRLRSSTYRRSYVRTEPNVLRELR